MSIFPKVCLLLLSTALIVLVTYQNWPSYASLQDVTIDLQHGHLKHYSASMEQEEALKFQMPPKVRNEKPNTNFHSVNQHQLRHRKLSSKSSKSESSSGKGSKSSKSERYRRGSSSSSSSCSDSLSSSSYSSSCDDTDTPNPTPAPTDANGNTQAPRTLPPSADDSTDVVDLDSLYCKNDRFLPTGAVLTVELDLRNSNAVVRPGNVVDARPPSSSNNNDAGFRWQSPATGWGGGGNRRKLQEELIGEVSLTAGGFRQRFAHFTYAIDNSFSTAALCDPDASDSSIDDNTIVLDCLKRALVNLNGIIANSDVAVNVGLVAWNERADRRTLGNGFFVSASDNAIEQSLAVLTPGGGTSLFRAMQASIQSVEEAIAGSNDIVAPAIIVITDGKDGTNYNDASDIRRLQELGCAVYIFAVGEESECTPNTSMTRLPEQTGGGSCVYVRNPADVELEVERVVVSERVLDSVTVEVQNRRQSIRTFPTIPSVGLVAAATPVDVFADLDFDRRRQLNPNIGWGAAPTEDAEETTEEEFTTDTPPHGGDIGFGPAPNEGTVAEGSSSSSSSSSSEEEARVDLSDNTATLNLNEQTVCIEAASRGDVAKCCVNARPLD